MIFRAVEDTDLIARVRKGDVEAFNVLISRWEKRVFNYLLRLVASPDNALDLSQDVFLKAWQNIRKLDDPARFGPWLYRIAHNEAFSHFRRRRPETSSAETTGTGGSRDPGDGEANSLERHAAPAFPIEMTLAVTAALDRLNPDQREAVILKVYEGLKFEEMAEVLECPVSTVKSRLYAALDLLRAELAPAKKVEVKK